MWRIGTDDFFVCAGEVLVQFAFRKAGWEIRDTICPCIIHDMNIHVSNSNKHILLARSIPPPTRGHSYMRMWMGGSVYCKIFVSSISLFRFCGHMNKGVNHTKLKFCIRIIDYIAHKNVLFT